MLTFVFLCCSSTFKILLGKFVRQNKKKQLKADENNLEACLVGPLFSQTSLRTPVVLWLVISAIDQLSLPSRDFSVDASAERPPTFSPSELLSKSPYASESKM